MRRLIFYVLFLSVLCGECFAGSPVQGVIARRNVAVSCDPALAYVGNKDTDGAAQLYSVANRAYVYAVTANCSSNLKNGYLNITTAVAGGHVNVCVYTRANDDAPPTVTSTDAKVNCTTVVTDSTGWATAAFSGGGSITSGGKYWILTSPDATATTGTVGIDRKSISSSYYLKAVTYGSEPATLGTGWTEQATTAAVVAGYGSIE